MSNSISKNSKQRQLACLYTKHKTQKRKIWRDGRLVLKTKSFKAVLHDADPPLGSGDPSLGECEIAAGQLQAILQQYCHGKNNDKNNNNNDTRTTTSTTTTLETERYLIEIEGPWTNNTVSLSTHPSAVLPIRKRSSKGMKKLLTSKFQKPKVYVPPPPGNQNTSRAVQVLGKRRRPLQPGELVARHYGCGSLGGDGGEGGNNNSVVGDTTSSSRGGFVEDRRNSYNQQDQRRESRHQQHRSSHSQIVETNGAKSPPLRSDLKRYDQQQQQPQPQRSLPHEQQPVDRMQSSFQTPEERDSLFLSGKAAGCPDVVRPISRNNAQRQRNRKHSNTSGFVQNEFDSARYYGIEGEEEEDEEKLTASSQAPLVAVAALPQLSSHAATLADVKKGKQRQNNENNNHIHKDPGNNRRNSTIIEAPSEGTIQTMDNNSIHQEEEERPGEQQNLRHGNQNHCLSFSSSLTTLNTHDNRISNNINNNDSRSISKVPLVEQQSKQPNNNKVESCQANWERHLEKVQEEDEEESESEEDNEYSENDDDAPSAFRLKPIKSFTTDAYNNNNTRVAAAAAMPSGNHLLTLFGAGAAGKQAYRNADEKPNESDDDVENDKQNNDEKERGNGSSISGFYLPAAATSSEESCDEDDGDEE
jgi:hypothetical protein